MKRSMVRDIKIGSKRLMVVGVYKRREHEKGSKVKKNLIEKGGGEKMIMGEDFNA